MPNHLRAAAARRQCLLFASASACVLPVRPSRPSLRSAAAGAAGAAGAGCE